MFPAGSNPALSSKSFGGVTEGFMVPDLNSGDSVIIPDRGFESYRLFYAALAQLVERLLAMQKVTSSNLVCRLNLYI